MYFELFYENLRGPETGQYHVSAEKHSRGYAHSENENDAWNLNSYVVIYAIHGCYDIAWIAAWT